MKDRAVDGGAPPNLERPHAVSYDELAKEKCARDDFERGKIQRILLVELLRRLRAGRTLERSHGVIHPEMTCIVRDVLRLAELVYPGAPVKREEVRAEAVTVTRTRGAEALAKLVTRSSATKVSKLLGTEVERVQAWAGGAERPNTYWRDTMEVRLKISEQAWGSE